MPEIMVEPSKTIRELVVIPTFNNRGTLRDVVLGVQAIHPHILVVDDGSTDGASETLDDILTSDGRLHLIRHDENRGKGAAIVTAGKWALENGFSHIITMDADGQHDPADLPKFFERLRVKPLEITIGVRDMSGDAVPGSSKFGRDFSNFWLRVACGAKHRDSQSGFRTYPVEVLRQVRCKSHRYDFEVEILNRSVWAGATLGEVDISVRYDEGTKASSSFDMWRDNVRISWLNTKLVARNLLIPWPHKALIEDPDAVEKRLSLLNLRQSMRILIREGSSTREVVAAAMLGIFLGTLPLIACHMVVIVFCATRLKLNRLIALNVSHLCAPPFVPAVAVMVGYYVRHGRWLTEFSFQTLGRELHQRVFEWLIGSLIVGPILAIIVGAIIWVIAVVCRRFRSGGTKPAEL